MWDFHRINMALSQGLVCVCYLQMINWDEDTNIHWGTVESREGMGLEYEYMRKSERIRENLGRKAFISDSLSSIQHSHSNSLVIKSDVYLKKTKTKKCIKIYNFQLNLWSLNQVGSSELCGNYYVAIYLSCYRKRPQSLFPLFFPLGHRSLSWLIIVKKYIVQLEEAFSPNKYISPLEKRSQQQDCVE